MNKTVPFLPELDRRPVLCLLELSLLVRPVAYADFQANAKSNWRVASSVMAGLQFENARIGDRKLQVLAEYFSGPSPNGQFYTQNTEWFGLASTCITDSLPLHRLRHAGFSGHTPSVEHKSSVRGLLRLAASTDSDARRGHWGGRRGLKRVLAVSTRDLNRILFSAGAPLRSPQRGSGPRNSEALVVRIEPARHPQPRGTHSTGMRSVQRANDRVRSGTCPWT